MAVFDGEVCLRYALMSVAGCYTDICVVDELWQFLMVRFVLGMP